jgi:hypothetical protein
MVAALTHTHAHIHTRTHTHTHAHAHARTRTRTRTRTHTHTHTHSHKLHAHMHKHTRARVRAVLVSHKHSSIARRRAGHAPHSCHTTALSGRGYTCPYKAAERRRHRTADWHASMQSRFFLISQQHGGPFAVGRSCTDTAVPLALAEPTPLNLPRRSRARSRLRSARLDRSTVRSTRARTRAYTLVCTLARIHVNEIIVEHAPRHRSLGRCFAVAPCSESNPALHVPRSPSGARQVISPVPSSVAPSFVYPVRTVSSEQKMSKPPRADRGRLVVQPALSGLSMNPPRGYVAATAFPRTAWYLAPGGRKCLCPQLPWLGQYSPAQPVAQLGSTSS